MTNPKNMQHIHVNIQCMFGWYGYSSPSTKTPHDCEMFLEQMFEQFPFEQSLYSDKIRRPGRALPTMRKFFQTRLRSSSIQIFHLIF